MGSSDLRTDIEDTKWSNGSKNRISCTSCYLLLTLFFFFTRYNGKYYFLRFI